jgi:cell division protein FtsB
VTNKKKSQRALSTPKIVAIVTFTLVGVLSVDFGRKALDNYNNQRQVEWLSQQVKAEQDTNQALQDRLDYVESDAYVEEAARESLGLVKAGEIPVVVVQHAESPLSPTSEGETTGNGDVEPMPYWQQWSQLLLGATD